MSHMAAGETLVPLSSCNSNGCSVWGAWWSSAPNWPESGEIDTFEGVNLVKTNQMALHTNPV